MMLFWHFLEKEFCGAVESLNRGMGKKSRIIFTSNSKNCTVIMHFINWENTLVLMLNITVRVTTVAFKDVK